MGSQLTNVSTAKNISDEHKINTFNIDTNGPDPTLDCDDLKNCEFLQRIKRSVNSFKSKKNIDNIHIATLNSDFLHLLQHHNHHDDEYEYIHKFVGGDCDANNCDLFNRNYRDKVDMKYIYNQKLYETYRYNKIRCQIIDKIHCFYRHSFDMGYRLNSTERASLNVCLNEEKKENDQLNQLTNNKWRQLHSSISNKRTHNKSINNRMHNKYHQIPIHIEQCRHKIHETFNMYYCGTYFCYKSDDKYIKPDPYYTEIKHP
eukprot:8237_1